MITKEELEHAINIYQSNTPKKPFLLVSEGTGDELKKQYPQIKDYCEIVDHPFIEGEKVVVVDAEKLRP